MTANGNNTVIITVLDGVANQVYQNLLQPVTIGENVLPDIGKLLLNRYLFTGGKNTQLSDNFTNQRRNGDIILIDPKLMYFKA